MSDLVIALTSSPFISEAKDVVSEAMESSTDPPSFPSQTSPPDLSSLPHEIIISMISLLNFDDIQHLAVTCRLFGELCADPGPSFSSLLMIASFSVYWRDQIGQIVTPSCFAFLPAISNWRLLYRLLVRISILSWHFSFQLAAKSMFYKSLQPLTALIIPPPVRLL